MRGRPRRAWIAVLLIGLTAGACGGSSNSKTETGKATPAATNATSSSSPTDCNALGINPSRMGEGTCTQNGTRYTIVDENHTLKLHTLSARLDGVRAQSSLGGTASSTPNGKFVVLRLALTNRLPTAQKFDASGTQQAGLILDETVYKEDQTTERVSDPASCSKRASAPIPAGDAVTCDVVFDVPAAAAADLGKHGSGDVYLVDFGEDLVAGTPPQTVGQIRLYH